MPQTDSCTCLLQASLPASLRGSSMTSMALVCRYSIIPYGTCLQVQHHTLCRRAPARQLAGTALSSRCLLIKPPGTLLHLGPSASSVQ